MVFQSSQPHSSKCQFEIGASAPEFEPFDKITNANTEKGEFETKNDETATANENVETQNKKKGRSKTKSKATPPPLKNFQTTSSSSTISQPTRSLHIVTYLPMDFTWSKVR